MRNSFLAKGFLAVAALLALCGAGWSDVSVVHTEYTTVDGAGSNFDYTYTVQQSNSVLVVATYRDGGGTAYTGLSFGGNAASDALVGRRTSLFYYYGAPVGDMTLTANNTYANSAMLIWELSGVAQSVAASKVLGALGDASGTQVSTMATNSFVVDAIGWNPTSVSSTTTAGIAADGDNSTITSVDFDAIEINLSAGGILGGGSGTAVGAPGTYHLGWTISQTEGGQADLNEMAFVFSSVPISGPSTPSNAVVMLADDGFGVSSFNSAANWSSFSVPVASNDYFTGAHLLRSPATESSYTFSGRSLSVDSGGRLLGKSTASVAPGQILTIDNLILNGGYADQANSPGYLTLAGGITVSAASSLGAYSTDTLEIQSVISGSASLTIPPSAEGTDDSGVVKLSASNTYSGILTVDSVSPGSSQGLLQLNHRDALASATLNNLNASGYAVTFASSANTGAFNVGALMGSGDISLSDTAGSNVVLSVGGIQTNTSYSGALVGGGELVKVGSGAFTLSGSRSLDVDVSVKGGTLVVNDSILSDEASLAVESGGVLQLNFSETNTVASLVLDGVLYTNGTFGAGNSGGLIAGPGVLRVQEPVLAASPYASSGVWQAYDGDAAPSSSGYLDVPFMAVSNAPSAGALRIAGDDQTAGIYYSMQDADVVRIAAEALRDDVERVTGLIPVVSTNTPSVSEAILIGTIGSSPLIDGLIASGKIDVSAIEGKWEAYTAAVVDNPMAGVSNALIIAGSDRRGTAFGVFALSESMGVSPWYFWADVSTQQQADLYVAGTHTQPSPGVKYRGIFLNDEDWGLQPWAAQTFEPEVGNIGPKTYATIYELLLRLHANCIWPAMHEYPVETAPFYTVPGNMEMADDYAIVISTSHHEPMLRNSHEYDEGVLGAYNYWDNRENIYNFWDERVEETAAFESIYTIGMRGRTDAGMLAPDGTTDAEKAAMIQNVIIPDQRQMITDHVNADPSEMPQIFIPYKETLVQYQSGLELPDDVTILWPDDNHGYIRQLSTEAERARSGGSGVYYHLSYWGVPSSYLWFCTTPPGMTCSEMLKAWDFEARNMWLVNVGDLKPMEIGTEFFLRLARNPEAFREFDQTAYFTQWASRAFDSAHAEAIADVLNDYFRLNIVKRPEHLNRSSSGFSLVDDGDEAQMRLDAFAAMVASANAIYAGLPEDQKAAFYELVLYPARASYYVNKRTLQAERSRLWAQQERAATDALAAEAQAAHDALLAEVQFYNQENAGGKWNRMLNPMDTSLLASWARETQNPFIEPGYGSYAPSAAASLGVSIEGSSALLESGVPGRLPTFNGSAARSSFIDVFNQGTTAMNWTAEASSPWIMLSQTSGSADCRIVVSIDWNSVPRGYAVPGSVTITGAGSERTVHLFVFYPLDLNLASLPDAVEDNGRVVIEAEDYTARSDSGDGTGWRRADQAAASNDGMAIQPVTADSLDPENLPLDAPCLSYTFHAFNTGSVTIRTQCLPTHRLTSDHEGVRYAISLNGEPPQIVDVYAVEYSSAWYANTVRAASIGVSNHEITSPGLQTIQVWMVDASVVLDKLTVEINTGAYEAEDLGVQDSNCSVVTFTDPPASGGAGMHIQSTAVGHYATLAIPNVKAGDYELTVRVKKWASRGIMQMAIAENSAGPFTDIGTPFDLYNASELYADLETLPVSFSSDGSKYFRCTVTGKNASASNYWILLDGLSLASPLGFTIDSITGWRAAFFGTTENSGDAADLADPDGDGINNLCEYSAGLYPTVANSGVSLAVPGIITNHFTASFTRMRDATDITYEVFACDDLLVANWISIWSSVSTPYSGGTNESVSVTVADPDSMEDYDSRFLRMEVSRP